MWVSGPWLAATANAHERKCESEKGAIMACFTTQAHFHMQG